jgi:hypothetical protein
LIQPENYAKLLELEANAAQLKLANKWQTYLHTIIEPIEGLAIPGIDREAIETVIGKLHVSSNFLILLHSEKSSMFGCLELNCNMYLQEGYLQFTYNVLHIGISSETLQMVRYLLYSFVTVAGIILTNAFEVLSGGCFLVVSENCGIRQKVVQSAHKK